MSYNFRFTFMNFWTIYLSTNMFIIIIIYKQKHTLLALKKVFILKVSDKICGGDKDTI